MNEFCITDSEGRVHWIMTCLICRGLVETGEMQRHVENCAKRAVWPL